MAIDPLEDNLLFIYSFFVHWNTNLKAMPKWEVKRLSKPLNFKKKIMFCICHSFLAWTWAFSGICHSSCLNLYTPSRNLRSSPDTCQTLKIPLKELAVTYRSTCPVIGLPISDNSTPSTSPPFIEDKQQSTSAWWRLRPDRKEIFFRGSPLCKFSISGV